MIITLSKTIDFFRVHQTWYSADDVCFVVWWHYTQESAEGCGARFRGMMHTFAVL